MGDNRRKHSYTVPCSSAFRDAVTELAARRGVNVGDLARSVLLLLPPETVAAQPDPGDPPPGDRETVILKSGRAKGRPWRRKPRLQVRMAPGVEIPQIRRALALARALEAGDASLSVSLPEDRPGRASAPPPDAAAPDPHQALVRETHEELERLRAIVSVLAFDPLPEGVHTREDALHVLGLPPGSTPDLGTLRGRFRMLATIHHPDSGTGDHERMSQLNAAMEVLRRGTA